MKHFLYACEWFGSAVLGAIILTVPAALFIGAVVAVWRLWP